ncbi:MAG: hypothetical protein VB934_09070 [Polyangiaceae bacterium]
MKRIHTKSSGGYLALAMLAGVGLMGCPEDPPPPGAQPDANAPRGAAVPPGSGSVTRVIAAPIESAKPPPPPVCEVVEKKIWAKHVNSRTGITALSLPGSAVMLGVAVGVRPHQLTFDRNGSGRLRRLQAPKDSPLATRIDRKDGVRHLQRVTVAAGGRAFADYRDKYKGGLRRRIACGPTDGEPYVVFDGKPLIAPKKKSEKKAKVAATPSAKSKANATPSAKSKANATPSAKSKANAMPSAKSSAKATAKAGAKSSAAAPRARFEIANNPLTAVAKPRAPKPAAKVVREMRDCRTISDPLAKDRWSVASELVGELQPDGGRQWRMELVITADAGKGAKRVIHSVDMGADPTRLFTFEAPVATTLADGSYVLAARYRGRLLSWILDADKRSKGVMRAYGGGYPGLPRLLADGGSTTLWTSQKATPKRWQLGMLRLASPPELPRALHVVDLGNKDVSRAEPTFARVGSQRWLSYHEGPRRGGRLVVMPIDAKLDQAGRRHLVTSADSAVYESHMFGLDGGKLLVVYILRPGPKAPAQLVSEVLRCDVKSG